MFTRVNEIKGLCFASILNTATDKIWFYLWICNPYVITNNLSSMVFLSAVLMFVRGKWSKHLKWQTIWLLIHFYRVVELFSLPMDHLWLRTCVTNWWTYPIYYRLLSQTDSEFIARKKLGLQIIVMVHFSVTTSWLHLIRNIRLHAKITSLWNDAHKVVHLCFQKHNT